MASTEHGTGTVAKLAREFAAHGMIESRSFYLLNGLPVTSARPLDDDCTLLPYPVVGWNPIRSTGIYVCLAITGLVIVIGTQAVGVILVISARVPVA